MVDAGQIWAPNGLIYVDWNGLVRMRRHVDEVVVLLGHINDGVADLGRGYNEAVAARADLCAPWCDRPDGHPDACPVDRSCWLFGADVDLSLYPEIEWSDDTMRPDHLQTSLRRRIGHVPEIWVSYEGETTRDSFEHRFASSDARALAAELVRLSELADTTDDD